MARSIEEKVEEHYKKLLKYINIRCYGKTEPVRPDIDKALKEAESKSGGTGNNYPDIKALLINDYNRTIPVMIEAKGTAGKLEKSENGIITQVTKKKDANDYSAIKNYAVNGALHYSLACLNSETIDEVIIIGINGSLLDDYGNVKDPEHKAYYVSKKNNKVPKLIALDESFTQFKRNNINKFFEYLDTLSLTDEEKKANEEKAENDLEERIHAIHQKLYEDGRLKTPLSTNEKLYLFCGLIMAGLKTEGMKPLEKTDLYSNDDAEDNDGEIILRRIKSFLNKKHTSREKAGMIMKLLDDVFKKRILWKPYNGESIIKEVYGQVKEDIIPLLESEWHLDFTGKILNRLSDWVTIDNDAANDVVLTPRYITRFMARLARTNRDSFVWDRAMGSGGFLVSAMDIMIADAKENITDSEELEKKINKIKKDQLLGVEILGNIYILAVLNMILMGDGSSKILNEDSHKDLEEYHNFPATVFLLNPPYSAPGKGFNFVGETLEQMTEGYAAILIQENAGSGQGLPYTKNILKKNTLVASIHMPADLFSGKASVSTAIYVFRVGMPHNEKAAVKFIDMSVDGYTRQNRKKSSQKVNLRKDETTDARYDEVVDIVLGNIPDTEYYTKENGLYIEDKISLEGNDWCFSQHKKIDICPTEEDFKKTVSAYLSFRVSQILKGEK